MDVHLTRQQCLDLSAELPLPQLHVLQAEARLGHYRNYELVPVHSRRRTQ